ncbi:unnamed protein product [Orchesella dallaii]|uniref:Uncharacterized protein n=1 Tax=Orchesella dallaii TaxID=48710 RepID=A0ABP1QPB1_9HEXA
MTAKSNAANKMDLKDVVSRNLEDIKQLESQIHDLLKTMQSSERIERVPTLSLPEPKSFNEGANPEVRMGWHSSEDPKRPPKGKTVPAYTIGAPTPKVDKVEDEGLSDFDIIEMCIKAKIAKYRVSEDSVFFTPVLDRCVFGMTLLNVADKKLRKPSLTLSVLLPEGQEERKQNMRSFHYTVQVCLQDVNPEKTETASVIPFQDTLKSNYEQSAWVMPGCEVLATANFAYPVDLFEESNDVNLLVSVTLDDTVLWTRQINVTKHHFNAAGVDSAFKRHHVSILNALEEHRECFKLERLAINNENAPFRSLKRFLFPLGYENIASYKTGMDTCMEIFTVNQPSMLWGTFIKVEKCSRKLNCIRCQISTRTTEQMQFIYTQFKTFIWKEIQKDNQRGMSGLTVSSLNSDANVWVRDKVEKEIQLIKKLPPMKSVHRKGKESGRTQQWKTDSCASNGCNNIDSCWIKEYSKCVADTDTSFIINP